MTAVLELLPDGSSRLVDGNVPAYIVGITRKGEKIFHPLETLHLILEGRAKLIVDGEEITDFVKALSVIIKRVRETCEREGKGCYLANAFWSMFTTYHDLRRKGRKLLPEARREGTIIEIRKGGWWAEYLVLEEGVRIPLPKLLNWIDEVRANDLKAVVAVVDRNGSVTYYESYRIEVKPPSKREERAQAV
jgi:tRNA splicing endonuclease